LVQQLKNYNFVQASEENFHTHCKLADTYCWFERVGNCSNMNQGQNRFADMPLVCMCFVASIVELVGYMYLGFVD
jgi:hypothetical protein